MEPVLQIRQLVKRYHGMDQSVLRGLDMTILPGERYGFLGPNGTGKTTTVSILSGLLVPDSGEVFVLGNKMPDKRKQVTTQIGVVPQNIALFPELTALENLRIFGSMYSITAARLKQRIHQLLELYGLTAFARKPVKTFSGGMKRSLNIIAGILHEPRFLLLDEPTVGIDVQTKALILDNLRQLNEEGTTILYTSHDMDEAQHFCTRVGIIDHGKLIAEDTPAALIQSCPNCENLESVYLHLTGKSLRN